MNKLLLGLMGTAFLFIMSCGGSGSASAGTSELVAENLSQDGKTKACIGWDRKAPYCKEGELCSEFGTCVKRGSVGTSCNLLNDKCDKSEGLQCNKNNSRCQEPGSYLWPCKNNEVCTGSTPVCSKLNYCTEQGINNAPCSSNNPCRTGYGLTCVDNYCKITE